MDDQLTEIDHQVESRLDVWDGIRTDDRPSDDGKMYSPADIDDEDGIRA
jgi:hypothetical protein